MTEFVAHLRARRRPGTWRLYRIIAGIIGRLPSTTGGHVIKHFRYPGANIFWR